ncbi:response regulator transcription factor [Candidatus Falkowbacteria bacterium]|nr:response regulator transcription factor [Candidatus Falkowbacteria bacterium]
MRLLLIEDEEGIAEFMVKALKGWGYAVDHADMGQQAIFLAKTNDYDVILSDLMLPDMQGFDVCREIRAVRKKVPIIMLTVMSDVRDKVKAFESGVDDYLTKPFALEELQVRIQAVLRRPEITIKDVYTVNKLVVDCKKRTVTLAGLPIELRVKEFALLEYLLRNRDIIQSRQMLLEHVWDMNVDPFTNTVDVHVRSLRRKLNDEEGHLIKTVHGVGYVISA